MPPPKSVPLFQLIERGVQLHDTQVLERRTKNPQRIDRGFRSGKVARSKVPAGSSSSYRANGQCVIIRVYHSAMIRKTGHKITFDVFDEGGKSYVQKCHAYAGVAFAAQLHRQHCYRVRFNTDPKYPLIEELITELTCAPGYRDTHGWARATVTR
jgi:hypothetical protein